MEEKRRRFDDARTTEGTPRNVVGWVKDFDYRFENLIESVEYANTWELWEWMDKPELKRIFSELGGFAEKLRILETQLRNRGLLGDDEDFASI